MTILSQPFRRLVVTVVALVALLVAAPPDAYADTAPASIAVPLLGTRGAASVYPSTLTVAARGGVQNTGQVWVTLHAVTHPCIEELAVLLVHNNTNKFLVLSNAGGCRALQGTDVTLVAFGTQVPDAQPPAPAYGPKLDAGVSNYGTHPVFPAPAPAGPYAPGLPTVFTPINPTGTWALYVYDTTETNRGVIAGGWSLHYDTSPYVIASQSDIRVPASGGGPGVAATYPITFDLSSAPAGVPATSVSLKIILQHAYPDDLRMVLQSPNGTAVILMANAGGSTPLPVGTDLTFSDQAPGYLPDEAPIASGSYKPTSYILESLPAPAPPLPYASTLGSLGGPPIKGIWRLWVFDDASIDSGNIVGAALLIDTELIPAVTMTPSPATSTQPFIRLQGTVGPSSTLFSPHDAGWRVTNGTAFLAAGPFTWTGSNGITAEVPLMSGLNRIEVHATNTKSQTSTRFVQVTVDEFTYSLAEGATGPFFDLDVALANPTGTNANVKLEFLPEDGAPLDFVTPLAAGAPALVSVDALVPGAAVSTVVHSQSAVPLAVERTMIWDDTGYGGHGGTAVAPATRWLFAEGSQGYFDTYVLLANANTTPVDVTVSFLLEGGGVVNYPVTVDAKKRFTLFAGSVPQLVNQSFGIDITASQPIIAERSMYLPGARLFEGGHESAGVNETSTQWFLAEGATGSFFDCFVLLSNPNAAEAHVTLTYLLPSGATVVKNVTVAAKSRLTINVETEAPLLANADVSTTIVSDIGIVAERAMYWPNISFGWREAHNSFGVTSSALRWGLADGRIGGARGYQTFVLLANPNPLPAEVQVRFLEPGVSAIRTYTLDPSSRRNIYVNADVPELGDGSFGVEVQVLNYQPIAVEKALYWNSGSEVFAGGTNVTATRLPPTALTP